MARARKDPVQGKSFAFFGRFAHWPEHLGPRSPEALVQARGGEVRTEVSAGLDYVVLGAIRGPGRAEARTQAERLRVQGGKPELLDEIGFLHLVRTDIRGCSFAFAGGFEHSSKEVEGGSPAALVAAAGGVVLPQIEAGVDYVVVGRRRAEGKTAALRRLEQLQAEGSSVQVLDEKQFFELVRSQQNPKSIASLDFPQFLLQLRTVADPRRIDRALKMLKSETFQLYSDVSPDEILGVVKSQTEPDTKYASWISSSGRYTCSVLSTDTYGCMGLQGSLCKHILVLLLGMTRNGGLDPATAFAWARACHRKSPREDRSKVGQILVRYKGAEAGEIDWRPTETIPEDYYAY